MNATIVLEKMTSLRVSQHSSFQHSRRLLAFSLPFIMAATLLSPQAKAADPADWGQLSQGKVVVKQKKTASEGVPAVEAKILLQVPVDKAWQVVASPVKLARNERKVKSVKVLSKTGNKQNVDFVVSMTPLLPTFHYVLLQELSPPNLLQFHRVSGSFKDIIGSWRLTPTESGKKSILTYTLQLDPGPLVPRSLLLGAIKSDLPNLMKNTRAAIENVAP
jgi:Polyketide cyclase / dehydrase and lipid transport